MFTPGGTDLRTGVNATESVFFQAEDGIRDVAVTGVQTCALPISWDVVRVAIAPNLPQEAGRTLGEIARRRSVDPLDGVCDFLLADRGEIGRASCRERV